MSVDLVPLDGYARLDPREMQARADAVLATLRTRRTIRDFSPDLVPRKLIETCIAAAATAPSGANQQPWFFTTIADPAIKRRIREAAEAEERAFYAERATPE